MQDSDLSLEEIAPSDPSYFCCKCNIKFMPRQNNRDMCISCWKQEHTPSDLVFRLRKGIPDKIIENHYVSDLDSTEQMMYEAADLIENLYKVINQNFASDDNEKVYKE